MPAIAFVLQRMQIADVNVGLFLATKYALTSLESMLHSDLNNLVVCVF